jgi:hypothetical protein
MRRPARALGRVAVRRLRDLGVERLSATDSGVEIVDLEPERYAVPVWAQLGIADSPMVVLDGKVVQLQHERSVPNQTLVLLSTVAALTAEQVLVPATAPWYIGDRDQRLWTHRSRRV